MELKTCRYCEKDFPLDFFEIANVVKGKEYRRHKCKLCYQQTKRALGKTRREQIKSFKQTLSCAKCGNSDFRVLEFHHKGNDKEFNISDAMRNHYSFKRIMQEINKCIPLCANCHRILHYIERYGELG